MCIRDRGHSITFELFGVPRHGGRLPFFPTQPGWISGVYQTGVRSARLARQHRPRVIVAGWTAYPRTVDWAGFRHIADEVGAFLVADMAHLAGLIAAGVYPSPVPYADVVTSTTHKTLGGARGGLILCRGSLADRIDAAVFPGHQGGALNQSIAAKAATFHLAGRPGFVERQRRTLQGAKMIAERLCQPDIRSSGIQVVTGGTDCHLVLLDWCCCNLGREPRKLRFYCVINAMCLCCQAVSNTRLTITASGFG